MANGDKPPGAVNITITALDHKGETLSTQTISIDCHGVDPKVVAEDVAEEVNEVKDKYDN